MSTDSAVRWNQDQISYEQPPKQPSYPYLFRILDLSPLVAQAALDGVHANRSRPEHPRTWSVQVKGGRLELQQVALEFRPAPRRPHPGGETFCRWRTNVPLSTRSTVV